MALLWMYDFFFRFFPQSCIDLDTITISVLLYCTIQYSSFLSVSVRTSLLWYIDADGYLLNLPMWKMSRFKISPSITSFANRKEKKIVSHLLPICKGNLCQYLLQYSLLILVNVNVWMSVNNFTAQEIILWILVKSL